MIEKLLHNPIQLSEQWTFQMTPQTKKLLIEKYYDFKDSVIREILGNVKCYSYGFILFFYQR